MNTGSRPKPIPAWRARIALLLYAALMRLLLPLMLLRLFWRGRAEPFYRQWTGERLGRYPADVAARITPGRLWLHAVSLGETRAAVALIDALRKQLPELKLLLTHGTATGRAAGQALLRPGDLQVWAPWDSPGSVRAFLAAHRPCAGILMETEIWPALLDAARQHGVPMLLANARLSAKSLRRQQTLPALMFPAMRSLERALAQTEADATRLREAGVQRVIVSGNLKFDVTPDPALLARGKAWRADLGRPVVMMASSREGEEHALLAAWGSARQRIRAGDALQPTAQPLLLLVPRHPQRFDAIAELCLATGLTLARRSSWADKPDAQAATADIWLGDSLGELPIYYAMADVALLGGSFAPLGGQNLIEAAACGCPLLIGPSTYNFAEAAELALVAGAATRADDLVAAVDAAVALLGETETRMRQVDCAQSFAAAHRGAADKMATAIRQVLFEARDADR